MADLDDAQLDAIRERARHAWTLNPEGNLGLVLFAWTGHYAEDVPALLALVDRLRAENERLVRRQYADHIARGTDGEGVRKGREVLAVYAERDATRARLDAVLAEVVQWEADAAEHLARIGQPAHASLDVLAAKIHAAIEAA